MFKLPDKAIVNAIVQDLENIEFTALSTFAGKEDPFILEIHKIIVEIQNLPTEEESL